MLSLELKLRDIFNFFISHSPSNRHFHPWTFDDSTFNKSVTKLGSFTLFEKLNEPVNMIISYESVIAGHIAEMFKNLPIKRVKFQLFRVS